MRRSSISFRNSHRSNITRNENTVDWYLVLQYICASPLPLANRHYFLVLSLMRDSLCQLIAHRTRINSSCLHFNHVDHIPCIPLPSDNNQHLKLISCIIKNKSENDYEININVIEDDGILKESVCNRGIDRCLYSRFRRQ